MTDKDFEVVVRGMTARCEKILLKKAVEYSRGDRLSNFKDAARLEKCNPLRALRGMMSKHVISIYDYIDDYDKGHFHTMGEWDEKILDNINYLLLLKGLLLDSQKKKP